MCLINSLFIFVYLTKPLLELAQQNKMPRAKYDAKQRLMEMFTNKSFNDSIVGFLAAADNYSTNKPY